MLLSRAGVLGILQQFLGAGVLLPDPGELFLAVDVLKPDVLVDGFGSGGCVPGRSRQGRKQAGEQHAVVVIGPCKQHRRRGSKSHERSTVRQDADTLDAVGTSQSIRTAVIGAGPRGTSVLERLLANWRSPRRPPPDPAHRRGRPLPGGPRPCVAARPVAAVPDEHAVLLPHNRPQDPELARPSRRAPPSTSGGTRSSRHPLPVPDGGRTGRAVPARHGGLPQPGASTAATCAPRWRLLLSHLPDGITVGFHQASAASVRPSAADRAAPGEPRANRIRRRARRRDGAHRRLGGAGPGPRRSPPERRTERAAGSRRGTGADVLSAGRARGRGLVRVPAGEPVLVRGMGLNFFDVMGQLTEGRGGKFVRRRRRRTRLPALRPGTAHSCRLPPRHPLPDQGNPLRLLPRRRLAAVPDRARDREGSRTSASGRPSTTISGRSCTAMPCGPTIQRWCARSRRRL